MKQLLNNAKAIIAILILSISFTGCENADDYLPEIKAEFTHTINQETGTVSFINTSSDVSSYLWTFGDGTTSTEINPIHSYPNGTYTITLKITNLAGATDTYEDTIIIDGIITCTAETAETLTATGLNMTFKTDQTTNFINDGANFSWEANPSEAGINTSCKVGKITKQGINPWDNTQINLNAKLDFNANAGLKVKVYSAKAGFKVRIKLEEIGNAGNNTELEVTSTKTNEWEELTFDFPTTASNKFNKIVLFFDLNANNKDVYYFDDLKVYARDVIPSTFDDGLLTNGDFENGSASWIIGVGTDPAPVVTTSGNQHYSVNVTAAGNAYDVNVSQKLAIIDGTTYTLTFDAWSDRSRTILAGIGLSGGSFANTTESVSITTTRTTFTLTLTASGFGATDARVLFDLGAQIGLVNIDNVSLVVKTGGGTGGTCPAPPSGELLSNGGFEANSGDGACWQFNAVGGTVAVSNADKNTGTYSAKLTTGTDQAPNLKMERFAPTMTGGKTIQVTFKYKITTALGVGSIFQVLAFSEKAAGAGAAMANLGNAADAPLNTWNTFTQTFVTDAAIGEGISLLLQLTGSGNAGAAGVVYVDDVKVTQL